MKLQFVIVMGGLEGPVYHRELEVTVCHGGLGGSVYYRGLEVTVRHRGLEGPVHHGGPEGPVRHGGLGGPVRLGRKARQRELEVAHHITPTVAVKPSGMDEYRAQFTFFFLHSSEFQPREWCYPQWANLLTSINAIKVIPQSHPKAHLPDNSRFCQVGE